MGQNKTILVTGASTGIGAATAIRVAANNRVLIHYNQSEDKAKAVAKSVTDAGGEPHVVQGDVSSEAGCLALMERVNEVTNTLDALFNNAGGLVQRQPAEELEWSLMERVFALNVFSCMTVASKCIPLLQKGVNPCIVNNTSIAMRHGAPTATIYGAAKSAMDSFTRGLAKELAPTIRVNAVAPGVVETPFHDQYSTPEQLATWREGTPLKRNGTPDAIAKAVAFLIDNDFITGETIDVNGGLFMR